MNPRDINDTYGHDIGDNVLIDFVHRVTQQVRKTDVFARFGGEEFVLLMPQTNEANCFMLMQRVRESINEKPFVIEGVKIYYTVSIGLVEVHKIEDMQEATLQFKCADEALYEAKRTGRNKVCVYRRE